MRWIRRTAVAIGVFALFGTALISVGAEASAATPCTQIYRIVYNSPGKDTWSNASLNGEWIQLHNRCTRSITLTSLRIRDAAGHVYAFSTYKLGPHKYVKVHTGRGTNTSTDRYWGLKGYVWNNDKDTAYYYHLHSTVIDKCSYSNSHASSRYC